MSFENEPTVCQFMAEKILYRSCFIRFVIFHVQKRLYNFSQVRQVMTEASERERKADTPLVYGLATAYSAAFIILAQYCCLLLFILLGENSALSAVLLFAAAFCLLALLAYVRLEASITARTYFQWWIYLNAE